MRPLLLLPLLLLASSAFADAQIKAKDSLAPKPGTTPAQVEFLRRAGWVPAEFTVRVAPLAQPAPQLGDAIVTFPSPKPSGAPKRDRVTAHWFKARSAKSELMKEGAPAAVVVHSLHPQMVDGFVLGRLLAAKGVHALMVELPGYGARAIGNKELGVEMAEHAAQAVADVRRARDVATCLPGVEQDASVGLEGLSLGGMVASSAAGLDDAFSPVVIVASGGDPAAVVTHGGMDAAWMRERLARAGYAGEKLRGLLDPLDPLKVAGRITAAHCWMYRAKADGVFPQDSGDRLVKGIGLPEAQVMVKPGNHYAAMCWLPEVAEFMAEKMTAKGKEKPAAKPAGR